MNVKHQQNDYTDSDIRIKPLVVFIATTLVVAVAVVFFTYYLFNRYAAQSGQDAITKSERLIALSRPTNAVVEGAAEAVIALAAQRAREDAVLNHYKWLDAEKGVVQIPVARAMEVMVENGLFPVRPAEAQ